MEISIQLPAEAIPSGERVELSSFYVGVGPSSYITGVCRIQRHLTLVGDQKIHPLEGHVFLVTEEGFVCLYPLELPLIWHVRKGAEGVNQVIDALGDSL